MHTVMKRRSLVVGLTLFVVSLFSGVSSAEDKAAAKDSDSAKKVLYFTHEPGKWHKYTPQLAMFNQIAQKAGWDVTVMTGEHEAQIERLRTPDYGKDFDAIVYNFCFADATDLEAAANLMKQTREHGVPALLIHCSMHSWWPTYKTGKPGMLGPNYSGQAKAEQKLVEQWRVAHPDEPFPVWGDFTGIASERHGPKKPIALTKIKEHPATARFPSEYTTGDTELYNNVYALDDVVPLIKGVQGEDNYVVMWTCPQGVSQVMALSLGHDINEWSTPEFQNLIVDGVNYLIAHPKP